MTRKATRFVLAAAAAATLMAAVSVVSCQQAATNVVTRSLQLPQKLDVVCLQLQELDGGVLSSARPLPADQCAPVPAGNTNPAALPRHLYAVVTQARRGELGVIDLTTGSVVDVDRSNPGVDFVPVGANPTDVTVTRDGKFTFVSSADPNKLALYGVDNARLLGNSVGTLPPLHLPDVVSCSLSQPPQAVVVLPSPPSGSGAPPTYFVVATLRGTDNARAEVDTIRFDTSMAPGALDPCPVVGRATLANSVPTPLGEAPSWPDGVPYAQLDTLPQPPIGPMCPSLSSDSGAPGLPESGAPEAGEVDAATVAMVPPPASHPTSTALRSDLPLLYVADGEVPIVHVIDLHDPANPRELAPLVATSALNPGAVPVSAIAVSPPTRDYKTYLYAVDSVQHTLMVFDVTDPSASPHVPLRRPHEELTPLQPPDRISFPAPVVAVAFAQHDWPLQLPGDTVHQYTGLLCNPNPNARPNATTFLDKGAYYRADPDLVSAIQATDTLGGTVQTLPTRLRGLFALATLSNGNVVTIDVDDWDAPCRRPDPMTGDTRTGVLDIPEPASAPGDLDPYHAPVTYNGASQSSAVTQEAFFPVSAPHRPRSVSLLRSDSTVGQHVPHVIATPQLFNVGGAAFGASGASPLMLPTPLYAGFVDPTYVLNPTEPRPNMGVFSSAALGMYGPDGKADRSATFPGCKGALAADGGTAAADPEAGCPVPPDMPGVRVSFDDPTAHLDQDWTVTYEGALPTINGVAASLASDDGFNTLNLSASGAHFCSAGIEDWSIGQARATQVLAELAAKGLPVPPAFDTGAMSAATLPQWTSDYVEIIDDLLPSTDDYWSQSVATNAGCWDDPALPDDARARYDFCHSTFGDASSADARLLRDLPIVAARDDSLRVTRFAWGPPNATASTSPAEQTTNRIVNPPDPSNSSLLNAVRCCFHHQARFKVRTGGEWVAVGTGVGLLHHVVADPSGACVLSCEPRQVLMNSRAFDIPWATGPACAPAKDPPVFDRDSPIALRNPMFSFVMWSGCGAPAGPFDHTLTTRDLNWKFSMRGSFSPQTVSLITQGSNNAVSPQSMRFIGPLGQMGVVDGEAQGIVLIDLNLVAVVHSYF